MNQLGPIIFQTIRQRFWVAFFKAHLLKRVPESGSIKLEPKTVLFRPMAGWEGRGGLERQEKSVVEIPAYCGCLFPTTT